ARGQAAAAATGRSQPPTACAPALAAHPAADPRAGDGRCPAGGGAEGARGAARRPGRRRRSGPSRRARHAPPAGAGGARLDAARVGARAGQRRGGGLTVRPRGTLGLMFAADRVQDLIRRLRDDFAAVVHAEIELAKTEVTEKVRTHAKAGALIAVAAAFAL